MQHLLDKAGTLGALIAAIAAPCCFPFLAPIGITLGLSTLFPFEGYALYAVQAGAAVAMVGSVVAFRAHRRLVWLLLGMGSGLLVIGVLAFPWPPSLAYAGLLGLAVAAVANHLLVRRVACSVTPSTVPQPLSEKPNASCPSETPEKAEVESRI